MAGLLFAYKLDFSLGPSLALFLGVALVLAALFCRLRRARQDLAGGEQARQPGRAV